MKEKIHQILFQIAKEKGLTAGAHVYALLDARRTEVYLQAFDAQGNSILNLQCALLENTTITDFASIIVVGDAHQKAKTFWTNPSIQWIEQALCAKFQVQIAAQLFEKQAFEDLAYCSPIYLKGANGVLL